MAAGDEPWLAVSSGPATALAVATVAAVAAVISYRHAYELITTTARPG